MYTLYFLYFEMSRRALEVFNCPEEPLTQVPYMQSLPWLQCSLYAYPSLHAHARTLARSLATSS
jgi:hypothetical protein